MTTYRQSYHQSDPACPHRSYSLHYLPSEGISIYPGVDSESVRLPSMGDKCVITYVNGTSGTRWTKHVAITYLPVGNDILSVTLISLGQWIRHFGQSDSSLGHWCHCLADVIDTLIVRINESYITI